MKRRDFLRSAVAVGAGSVLGAGLAYQTTPAQAATVTEVPSTSPSPLQAKEDIRAVGIFPISGFIASDGIEMRNGTVMGIDEVNELTGNNLVGYNIKYIEVDDVDSVGDQVTTAFQRAIDVEKADAIFSGYHLTSTSEFDICADAGVLYYNNNTQKAWTDRYQKDPERYWSIFQTDPNDEWYGGGFARYVKEILDKGQYTPEKQTMAILHGDDTYDTFIALTFEAQMKGYGWETVVNEPFTAGTMSDWGPLLSKVYDNPPGILFTTTYNPADNAAMIKQWVNYPLNCIIYQQYGPSVPEYFDLAGEASNGILWATVLGYLPDAIGDDWTQRYEAKFNAKPGFANAPGDYDSVWVWAKAVALAADPRDYKKVAKMTEIGIHRGVTGSISFENHASRCYPWQTPDSSLGQAHTIYQCWNLEHHLVFPAPYAKAEFKLPPWFA
jgi:branched-chain amino acid transport system substrate-binding protein